MCEVKKEENNDIKEGFLHCKQCKRSYPIKEGVPQLLYVLNHGMNTVQNSFSTQWEIHNNYNKHNAKEKIQTWGLEAQERKKLFLRQMEVSEKELKGKWLLDAGSGNGLLTIALGEFDLNVVGLDLSDGIFFAARRNTNPNVHFVQGDVMHPPFKASFDYVFSCGVLHHTYNTRKAFDGISKCVKPKGKIWVWLYLKISQIPCKNWIYENKPKLYIYDWLNKFISRLPQKFQDTILLAAIPVYLLKQEIEIITGLKKFDPTNQYLRRREHWKDKLVMLHDNFTPRYAFRHTPKEVAVWFKENGFSKVCYNYKEERGGFGMIAIRAT